MEQETLTVDNTSTYKLSPMTTGNAHVDPNDILNYKLPDPSQVLTARHDRFVKALKTLENYAEGYRTIAVTTIKNLDTMNNNTADGIPHFESSRTNTVSGSQVNAARDAIEGPPASDEGGVSMNYFFGQLRDNLGKTYAASVELENKISTNVLPDLKAAQVEVEKKRKELRASTNSANREYAEVIKHTAEANNDLNIAINAVKVKGKVEFKKDPFLVKRGLLQKAAVQIRTSNDRVDFLQKLERSSHDLEGYIIGVIQRIFNELSTILTNYFGSNVNIIGDLNTTLTRVDPEISWDAFMQKNSMLLVSSYIPDESVDKGLETMTLNPLVSNGNPLKRDFNNIVFNNQHDPLTSPVLEGNLYLREGLLKKEYKSIYIVVTPANYLLGFPTKTVDNVDPSIVIYLPDADVKDENTSGKLQFTLKGRDRSNLINRTTKTLRFKASSHEDFVTWVNTLAARCGGATVTSE